MLSVFSSGFAVGAGLIIAIGAQNAFVLGQGLRRQHHILVGLICTLCDCALIAIGVGGLGAIISTDALWTDIMSWGGAAFLGWYGLQSFRSLFRNHGLEKSSEKMRGKREIVLFTLAVTLLNPHVYLDTVVLLGGISAQYIGQEKKYFALGAMLASLSWFTLLSAGAAWASPYLARPITWKVLDFITGCVMFFVAAMLIWP